ncbi:MAG TPA: HlyD family type I secretion periplasmic adaptor subunit [Alphaproteobacteria bacterium]|jgi:adhesin transport system membrane fusion protein|nr:HlyD family type I secretion periplasmic adaptor subunit [Alphaproteobacteria bacterium]
MLGKKKKPLKEIKGHNPNIAKAMQMQMRENMTEAERAADDKKRWLAEHIGRVQAQGQRFFDTDEDMPLSSHLLFFFIIGFFTLFFLWASFAKLDEVTRGQGTVIPSSEIQKISSLEGGIIDEFFIKKGDEVQKGDTLVRLSDIAASSDYGSNNARYLGLLATISRLQAEVEGRIPEFPKEVMEGAPQSVTEEMNAYKANNDKIHNQTSIMEQQKSQRSQELSELQIRSSDIKGQLALIREQKSIVEPLVAKGSAPKMELLQLDQQIKEKQTELNGVLAAVPRARSAISEANARIEEVKSTAKAQSQTELSAKLIEMNAIKQGLAGLEDRKTRADVKSPVNGYIKDLKVYTVGGVVQPGQVFIEIVPKDDQLLVEAKVNPKDIAFLYPEQPAIVKITAYDFAIYGGLKGKVVSISPDAVTNEKGESFYLVQVLTEENALKRKDEVLPIIPGMIATVDILTGHKTVMEYLLKPFIKTLSESMNER